MAGPELHISGEDVVARLTSKSDSCALVRGPRAGASYEVAGPISAFTPSFPPSLSTCSVQGSHSPSKMGMYLESRWGSLQPGASQAFTD